LDSLVTGGAQYNSNVMRLAQMLIPDWHQPQSLIWPPNFSVRQAARGGMTTCAYQIVHAIWKKFQTPPA